VIVGSFVGGILAIIWFYGHIRWGERYFKDVESWSISKMFYLRDTSDIEDVFHFEYEVTSNLTKNKIKKL
jgi:hypothetical protein